MSRFEKMQARDRMAAAEGAAQNILATSWDNFVKMAIHPDVSPEGRDAMQQAFYAGALTVVMVNEAIGEPGCSVEAGMVILTGVSKECTDYRRMMMARAMNARETENHDGM